MEKSYFWNSVDGDRKYNAESISDMLLPFFKPGVFAGDLQVTAPGGMKVQIAGSEDRGFAWFRTKNYHNTANLVKDISAASGVLSRIDNVVVRKDTPNRTIYIKIQEGTFATVPEAPAILRNAEFYDLKLAEITIPSGAIEITQANIKDCRMDANVCGWVAATIEEMDFTQISAQFDTFMDEYKEEAEIEFTNWFNAMKGQLTTDAAGNLQTQINTINTNAGGWKRYALVTNIDATLSLSASTMFQIVNKMTNFSLFTTAIDTSTSLANTDIPTEVAGLLDITKVDGRAILRFTQHNGNTWERVCALTSTESTMTAWRKLTYGEDLYTWTDITWAINKNPLVEFCQAFYNPATKEVKITFACNGTLVPTNTAVLSLPLEYRPTAHAFIHAVATAKMDVSWVVSDWNPVLITVTADGNVATTSYTGADMRYFRGTFSYIAV